MEYYVYRNPNDELIHWGVRGMKWGVRRYQNKDGSLTAAGKKRRAKLESKSDKLKREIDKLDGVDKNSDSPRKKSVGEMTNAELKAATERLNVEKSYYEAQKNLASVKPKQVNKGKEFAQKLLGEAIIPSVTNVAKDYISKELKKKMGIKEDVKVNWDEMLKKQSYAKNEADKIYQDLKRQNDINQEKDRAEARDKKRAESAAKSAEGDSNGKSSSKSADESNTTSSGAKGVKGEKWEKKSSEKVYEGTVEGTGTSGQKRKAQSSKKETVIDAEWSEVEVSSVPASVTNRGQSYVTALLESPDRWDDD